MTHYICPDPDCLAKGFIAFKTQPELISHRFVIHEKNTGTGYNAVTGFYTEGSKLEMDHIKLEDREGIDFEM